MDPVTVTIFIALGAFIVGLGSMAIAFYVANHNRNKASESQAVQHATNEAYTKTTLDQITAGLTEIKHTVRHIDSKLDAHTGDIIRLQSSDDTQWKRIESIEDKINTVTTKLTKLEQSHNNFHTGLMLQEGGKNSG